LPLASAVTSTLYASRTAAAPARAAKARAGVVTGNKLRVSGWNAANTPPTVHSPHGTQMPARYSQRDQHQTG
jgi:hypothetical protein